MDSMAPKAARVRKPGTAAVATTTSALLRTKTRRVMDINDDPVLSSQFPVTSYELRAKTYRPGLNNNRSPSLKLRRTQQQARNQVCSRRLRRLRRLVLGWRPRP